MTADRRILPIEGLRAIAVVGVLLFHLFPATFSGGFLGVDLFFVISGYVITSLLANEMRHNGEVDLRRFYSGRVRRLAPAAGVVLGTSLLFASLTRADIRDRALSDLPYVMSASYNWHLSTSGVSYFDQWTPPIFQHLWSLAVETQFYTLWPLLFVLLTYKLKSSRIAIALISSIAALTTAIAVTDGVSAASFAASYFNTYTHLAFLLVGAILGLFWYPNRLNRRLTRAAHRVLVSASVLSLLGLVAGLFILDEANVYSSLASTPLAIFFGLLLAAGIHPSSPLHRILATAPLVSIGRRSYSIYLWHWPVQNLLPSMPTGLHALLSLTLVFGLSELTYRFVEVPFRNREFSWDRLALRGRLAFGQPIGILTAGILVALAVGNPAPASAPPVGQGTLISGGIASSVDKEGPTSAVVIGDSVLLGIKPNLPANLTLAVFDAVVGRQASHVLADLSAIDPSLHNGVAIINLGNNGRLRYAEVRAICEQLGTFKSALVVNTRVPRAWQDLNNELMARVVAQYPTITLVDWFSISDGHPEYLGPDGVHTTRTGAVAYANAIAAALR